MASYIGNVTTFTMYWHSTCHFLAIIILQLIVMRAFGSLVAVSNIQKCINVGEPDVRNKNGMACGKKMIIALTVTGNESKAQYLEANVSLVTNETVQQRLRIKKPIRIRIKKTSVKIVYPLHFIGMTSHHSYESTIGKSFASCRDDWYAESWDAACGFEHDSRGQRIFDSQGFCCGCGIRGSSVGCHGSPEVAHCLRKHWLKHRVYDMHPSEKQYSVVISIEEFDYARSDGTEIWRKRSVLNVGPHQRIAISKDRTVKVEHIGDLSTARMPFNFQSKYLLIPALDLVPKANQQTKLYKNMTDPGNWILVDKHLVDLTGLFCDKIGVSHRAFRNQGRRCTQARDSCLQGQPHHLYQEDLRTISEGRRGQYLVRNFGQIDFLPSNSTALQFRSIRLQKSMIVLTLAADELRMVVNVSPGRIVEAFIESFEALSINGLLVVLIENTGEISARYQVSVVHCSAGIEYVPAVTIFVDPGLLANASFAMYSYHSVSQINTCEVELYDEAGTLLDNQTVSFTTFDTCFCHGYCGCSCGNNQSNCPEVPDIKDSLTPSDLPDIIKIFKNLGGFLQTNLGAIIIGAIIVKILILLGIIKVVLMIISGEIKIPGLWMAIGAMGMAVGIPTFATNMAKNQVEGFADHGRPARCDGTCSGAREARINFRKNLKVRKSKKGKDDVWWNHPYVCTCKVRETKTFLEIVKGTCFFLYCPFLPIWWILEFTITIIRNKQRVKKRKQQYRKKKIEEKLDGTEFLSIDDYSKGRKEKKKFKSVKEKLGKRSNDTVLSHLE